jgi:SAM-dependent methyltransferase
VVSSATDERRAVPAAARVDKVRSVTEAEFLHDTRESYDAVVADHVDRVRQGTPPGRWYIVSDDLTGRPPLERALLTVFAQLVQGGGGGIVADVGCGAGSVTQELVRLGLDAFGIDLSRQMVALARHRYPELRFDVGSMFELGVADGSLGGVLANNSIIHVPWSYRPQVFAEFHRALRPGGQLMLSFGVGSERRHFDEVDGIAISLDWYRQQPDEVCSLLADAGFDVRVRAVDEPEPGSAKPPHGYLLAHSRASGRPTV